MRWVRGAFNGAVDVGSERPCWWDLEGIGFWDESVCGRELEEKTRPRLARKHGPTLQDAFFFPTRSIREASARQHQARCSAQTGRCKLVYASCTVQVARRKLLRASCSVQVGPCKWLPSSCSVQIAPCKLLPASCSVQAALCKLLCASCSA